MAIVWKFMFRRHSLRSATCKAKPLVATLMLCAVSATGAAMDREQFKNVPPEIREWFENMRSPKGIMCCSYADGHRTGYDIRQGQYWVSIEGEWYPVPPETVIKTENPVGEAIVWYLHQGGPEGDLPRSEWYKIICFVPSGRRLISIDDGRSQSCDASHSKGIDILISIKDADCDAVLGL